MLLDVMIKLEAGLDRKALTTMGISVYGDEVIQTSEQYRMMVY
jgi:hypothetical protein